jgi:hypothetical protein
MNDAHPAEMAILEHFQVSHLLPDLGIMDCLKLCAEKAFLENDQSPYADALRRGWRHLYRSGGYRGTEEYHALITVHP